MVCFYISTIYRHFQCQEPPIHVLYKELSQLICIIAGYMCKENAIDEWLKKNTFELFNGINLKDIDEIYQHLPIELKTHDNGVAELDKKLYLTNIRNHLVSAGKHILKKS